MKAIKVMGTVDEQVIVLIPEDTETEENQTKEEILNDFRISWQEAMNGETIPVE